MIQIKDHKTGYIFDPWDYLGPKRRKLMEESWAGMFRQEILNELPVNKIASAFSDHGQTLGGGKDPGFGQCGSFPGCAALRG